MNVLSVDLESWVHQGFQELDTNVKKEKDAKFICDATLDILELISVIAAELSSMKFACVSTFSETSSIDERMDSTASAVVFTVST